MVPPAWLGVEKVGLVSLSQVSLAICTLHKCFN